MDRAPAASEEIQGPSFESIVYDAFTAGLDLTISYIYIHAMAPIYFFGSFFIFVAQKTYFFYWVLGRISAEAREQNMVEHSNVILN